jgi:long-subunit acyl-CoA synthetase (AMP-forming)
MPKQYFSNKLFSNLIRQKDIPTGKSMTYSQLLSGMDRVASALLKRGFNTKDTVLFVVSNHVEFPVMFFAVWMLGGINTCLKLNMTPGM